MDHKSSFSNKTGQVRSGKITGLTGLKVLKEVRNPKEGAVDQIIFLFSSLTSVFNLFIIRRLKKCTLKRVKVGIPAKHLGLGKR